MKLAVLDVFSGLGGFSMGLEVTGGFETRAFCEIDPWCRKILATHWPMVPCHNDITTLRGIDVGSIDVICGGFPCQDASVANQNGMGTDGDRTGLFIEIIRLARDLGPRYIIMENVTNLLNRGFGDVLGALAEIGYDAEWDCISAAECGADHERDRLWIVAYPKCQGREGPEHNIGILGRARKALAESVHGAFEQGLSVAGYLPSLRGHDGLSVAMERRRLHALGNAVVPQIPELIGNAILAALRT